jgi:hypothetical protein
MTDSTLLVISAAGVPPYSARGLTQVLEPIDAATNLRRTVNGALQDLSATQLKKYKSTITCTDMDSPALDGVWPGTAVTIDCVTELSYLTSGGTPARSVVSGSSRADGDFTFYRPQLSMVVTGLQISLDEYGRAVAWQLVSEEA